MREGWYGRGRGKGGTRLGKEAERRGIDGHGMGAAGWMIWERNGKSRDKELLGSI